ncbi:MAG: aspartyl/asparaginyl beta-hydroxylase domain-containing protein, partial [Acidobacteriota bacterium]
WERGKCFAFDDTFEHEAWNRSGTTRAVLLGDIWNPFLRPAEREVIAELVARIGDFNRAAAPAPTT